MKTIKGEEIGRFKDGGTKTILGEDGNIYFIDYRIASRRKGIEGKVYNKNPNLKSAKVLDIRIELVPPHTLKVDRSKATRHRLPHF